MSINEDDLKRGQSPDLSGTFSCGPIGPINLTPLVNFSSHIDLSEAEREIKRLALPWSGCGIATVETISRDSGREMVAPTRGMSSILAGIERNRESIETTLDPFSFTPPTPTRIFIGLLKELRIRGITRKWIVAETGIPASTIRRLEGGEVSPRSTTTQRIEQYLSDKGLCI